LIDVYYNDYHLIGVVLTKEGLVSSSNRWMAFRGDKGIESIGFKGYETFATNRGYIWSRTIPLIKNSILLGYGPDTFPIYFPQYDYLGKLRYYETGNIFVDKAHNLYIQTAMNSGMAALLALLALFGIYFVTSVKIYIKEKFESFLPYAGFACFAAFVGYAVAGLANDSVISVAPVFWVLLGLGIGINLRLKGLKIIEIKTARKV
jgi:O-antigen ligase